MFLGAAVPGDVVGNFHSALNQLADRATYFYSGSGKYWYDLQANISRRAKDQADRLHPEDVWKEIRERLLDQAKQRGAFAGVYVCPEETGDIPDTDEARLVIVHPRLTHRRDGADSARAFAQKAAEHRGSASRFNRNMVVFLAADEARMEELDQAIRTYLGWSDVLDKHDELDLTQNQRNQAAEKQRQAGETAAARLLGTYQWALVPSGRPVTIGVTKVEGQAPSLAERVSRRLGNDGELSTQQAGATIRFALDKQAAALWKDGHVAVGDLWQTYAQYPYMPRLTDRSVLHAGLQQFPMLWEQDGFALADGYDADAGRYRGLVLPSDAQTGHVTDQTLVVRPDVALAQRAAETAPATGTEDEIAVTAPGGPGEVGGGDEATPPPPVTPGKTRFFATKRLSAERYAMDFKHVADEVLAHLAATPGATVTITLEIEATAPDGFDEARVRTVSENATSSSSSRAASRSGRPRAWSVCCAFTEAPDSSDHIREQLGGANMTEPRWVEYADNPGVAMLPYAKRQRIVVVDDAVAEAERQARAIAVPEAEEKGVPLEKLLDAALVFQCSAPMLAAFVGKELYKKLKSAREQGIDLLSVGRSEAGSQLSLPVGHPLDGVVCVGDPARPNVYHTLAEFHRRTFEHKFAEAVRLLMALGATRMRVSSEEGRGADMASELDVPLQAVAGKVSARRAGTQGLLFEATLAPNQPRLPGDLVWYPQEPNWRTLPEGCLGYGLADFSLAAEPEVTSGSQRRFSKAFETKSRHRRNLRCVQIDHVADRRHVRGLRKSSGLANARPFL